MQTIHKSVDLTLQSAAELMSDNKHFMNDRRGTFMQTLALLFLGSLQEKESIQGL